MDTVNSKDALFMLDTSIEEDMKSYGQETTGLTIKYINSTPELYAKVVGRVATEISETCKGWANQHGQELGDLFITELDVVDWSEVSRRV